MTTLEENFEVWKRGIVKYCGDQCAENLIQVLGGKQKIKEATFSPNADSGMAGKGQLLIQTLNLVKYAIALNKLLPQERQADESQVALTCLLSHLSKVTMFVEKPQPKGNTMYDFDHTDRKTALRTGEKSIFLSLCAGISLSEQVYEAMRIIDIPEDDNMVRLYSSNLASIVKMANTMLDLSNNKRLNN